MTAMLIDDDVEDLKYYAKRKLVVDWDKEDGEAIEEIRNFAETVYLDMFGDILLLIEELYDKTDKGENWGLLTTKHMESYLLKLSKLKVETSTQINRVKLDALFAKYSLDDDFHAAYLAGGGTNNLREAKAHTETIEKRYSYFFRFYIHTMCEGLAREIDGLVKNLNSALFRRGSSV